MGTISVTAWKTIQSIRGQVEEIRGKLGPRAGLDHEGGRLLHEANAILLLVTLVTDKRSVDLPSSEPISMRELHHIADRTAALVADFQKRTLSERRRKAAEAGLDTTNVAIVEALQGPSKITLERCPVCEACPWCTGAHMVTPARAEAWRQKKRRPLK